VTAPAVAGGRVRLGERMTVSFQRTLRVPDDGRPYPLPPSLGPFPLQRVEDHADRIPDAWRREGGVFLPLYQREALWLGFDGTAWKPNAVKVGVGRINALSGEPWDERLRAAPQDYLVCPDQPWLDGINAGDGLVRQFVAMPLGLGYTVEAQLGGAEDFGGIQLAVYEPRPGRFPDRPPPAPGGPALGEPRPRAAARGGEMGLGAGGRITQRIYPDPYGLDAWQPAPAARLSVHLLNSEQYTEVTGRPAPPTPVSARLYTEHGLPWFALYDEAKGTIAAAEKLTRVRSVGAIDAARERADAGDASVDVETSQIRVVHPLSERRSDR
jgi:hypothetical protein